MPQVEPGPGPGPLLTWIPEQLWWAVQSGVTLNPVHWPSALTVVSSQEPAWGAGAQSRLQWPQKAQGLVVPGWSPDVYCIVLAMGAALGGGSCALAA